MESVGQQRPSGACTLLAVPGLGTLEVDDDDCEVVIGIRPKSSPLPRRRSWDSDEDSEPGPPPSGSRRVSFADARGLSLVHVKEFDTWNVTKLPEYDSSGDRGSDAEVYFLSPLTFSLPLSTEGLLARVREHKVELESVELLPGTTVLKGVIRVLNVSFDKAVFIRTTLDGWSSHFDLLAEYVPGSSDGATDRFSFKLALVPPLGEQGARVDFCLRYETPAGTFWSNNNDRNYALFCLRRAKERKETPQSERVNSKSCLKTVCRSFSTGGNIGEMEASSTDASDDGAKGDSLEAEKTSDGQSATSEEDRQKLLAENRQICSQRSSRKAARMARVKDHFSQRNAGVDDTQGDENRKAAEEETPERKHSDVRPLPGGSGESEGARFVSEPLDTRNQTSVSKAGEGGRKRSAAAARPADRDVPEERIESPDSQTNSVSFGTVVAPLYHQVFGRVGNKSARGNPAHATSHAGGLGRPRAERGRAGCTANADAEGDGGKTQGRVIQSTCSNTQCSLPNCPPLGKEETSLSVTASDDVSDHKETLRDPDDVLHSDQIQTNASEAPEAIFGDTTAHSHTANGLNTEPPSPRTPAERWRPRGDARGDKLPEHTLCPRAGTAPREAREAAAAFAAPRPPDGDETQPPGPRRGAGGSSAAAGSTGGASGAPRGLDPNHVRDSDTEETGIRCVSCSEKVEEEEDVTKAEMSLETNYVEEGSFVVNNPPKAGTRLAAEGEIIAIIPYHHGEDAQNIEHHEMDSKQEELCSSGLAAVNWETMVEEEEKNILTDEEESLKTAGNEQRQLEDAGRQTAFENKDATETVEDIFWEIKAARQKNNEAKDADVSGGEQTNGEECGEIMAPKGMEEVAKELEYTEAPNEAGEEDLTQEKREEQEFVIERKNVQNKESVEVTETHLSDDDQAGVGWEDQVKPAEVHLEEETFVVETQESEIIGAESQGPAIERVSKDRFDITQDEAGDAASAVANNVQDETATGEENQHTSTDTHLCEEDGCGSCEGKAAGMEAGEPESDQTAESDSDDEVELYMRCLRAVHAGAQRARNRDAGLGEGKSRPPAARGKLPPMPSISECQDEEQQQQQQQHRGRLPDAREDGETAPGGRGGHGGPGAMVSRRMETISRSEISKMLLFATSLVVFLVVAYRYDFLACLGLYLVSVVWLYCQEERQPKQQKNQRNTLD